MLWDDWKPTWLELTGEHFVPGERLLTRAADVSAGLAIVEVGSYCGLSAMTMAMGAQQGCGAHVYNVDTWQLPTPLFNDYNRLSNLGYLLDRAQEHGLLSQITPLRGYSVEMAAIRDWQIGLLFIDAAHERVSLQADMEAWLPHVVPGGYVLFHDYHYPHSPEVAPLLDEWWGSVSTAGTWCERAVILPEEENWTLEVRRCE